MSLGCGVWDVDKRTAFEIFFRQLARTGLDHGSTIREPEVRGFGPCFGMCPIHANSKYFKALPDCSEFVQH